MPPRAVGLAQAWGTIGLNGRTVLTSVSGATVLVCNQGTTTPISETIYADPTTSATLTNPLTTDATGTKQFYLEDSKIVTLVKTATGYTFANEDIPVIEPPANNYGVANGVATLDGSGKVPAAQIQEVLSLTDLSDAVITSAASAQQLVFNNASPPKLVNISHIRRPQAYVGFAGDGTTDDSAVITTMINEGVAAGSPLFEFPNKVIACKNIEPLQTGATVDLNGAILTLPAGAISTDDVLRSAGFTSLTGTNRTTLTTPATPYGFTLMNGTLDTGSANLGRHACAIDAIDYRLHDLKFICQSVGAALWEEYGGDIEDWGTGPNYRKGDSSRYATGITIMDAPAASPVSAPSANNMSVAVSGVTNAINPTITTARNHWLIAGQSVTIASVVGSTGVNGTWTVTTVASPTTFTITTAAPGAYTSGGTVAYSVSGAWVFLGPHDSYCDKAVIVGTSSFRAQRRGILCGNSGFGSSTGSEFGNVHVYGNFDVGIDMLNGGYEFENAQAEGSRRCMVAIRSFGGSTFKGRIFGGQGGVTLLSMRDANGNIIVAKMEQGGQNQAPPSGFTYSATYFDTYNTADDMILVRGSHDYNTTAAASVGTEPTRSNNQIILNMYAATSAATTGGWLSTIAAGPPPIYGRFSIPSGATWATN